MRRKRLSLAFDHKMPIGVQSTQVAVNYFKRSIGASMHLKFISNVADIGRINPVLKHDELRQV